MTLSRPGLLIAAILAAAGLAGCDKLVKSPAEGITFKAPPSWHSSPGIMGMMQFWINPNDDKQILMLLKAPSDWKADEDYSTADMKNVHVEVQRDLKICGNHDATFVRAIGTSSRTNNDANVDMVTSKASDGTFVAFYIYPIGTKPGAAPEAAIYELCPAAP